MLADVEERRMVFRAPATVGTCRPKGQSRVFHSFARVFHSKHALDRIHDIFLRGKGFTTIRNHAAHHSDAVWDLTYVACGALESSNALVEDRGGGRRGHTRSGSASSSASSFFLFGKTELHLLE